MTVKQKPDFVEQRNAANGDPAELSILRLRQVTGTTTLPKSTLYALISRGEFPQPIHLGGRSSGWLAHEVQDWIARQMEQSRANPAPRRNPVVKRNHQSSATKGEVCK